MFACPGDYDVRSGIPAVGDIGRAGGRGFADADAVEGDAGDPDRGVELLEEDARDVLAGGVDAFEVRQLVEIFVVVGGEDGGQFALDDGEVGGDADLVKLFGADEDLDGPVVAVKRGAEAVVSDEPVCGGEIACDVEFKHGAGTR